MMKKSVQYLLLCFILAVGCIIAPKFAYADNYSLPELRIAATLSLEVGGHKQDSLDMVAAVIQQRYKEQNNMRGGYTSWADILYGTNQFEHSRGFASKTQDELLTYIKNKSGSNWSRVLQTAQKVYHQSMNTSILNKNYKGRNYTINSFMMNFSGREKYNGNSLIQTGKLAKDSLGVDYFWASPGKYIKFGNYVHFDENTPDASKKYDNAVVDRYINGATGNYSSGGGGGGGGGGSSGGGSSRSAPKHKYEKSEGHNNREQCSMDSIRQSYGPDNDSCWYCNVVVILTNAYLNAAGGALPSSIALGKLILKLGFMIWLAYYILQQVSSFTPVAPSKILQDILVMGFKVALATLAVDAANSVIIEFYVNPIGTLGTDYGMAIYNKLLPG